jgi:hypothetical protein
VGCTKIRIMTGVLFAAGVLTALSAGDDAPAKKPADPARTRAALHRAVDKNLAYGREWLEGKDFESLGQTAEGLIVLAQLLARHGEDKAWQAATAELQQAAKSLKAAAEKEEEAACRDALALVGKRNKELAGVAATGKPAAPRRPDVVLPSVMALLDGTYADAKAALAASKVDEAKDIALVLAELGGAVATFHDDAKWRELAGGLSDAARAAADSSSRDAKAVRDELRGVYQRCEACHNARKK